MRELEVCPHPNCQHIATVITNVHSTQVHRMSKSELVALYGKPTKKGAGLDVLNRNRPAWEKY